MSHVPTMSEIDESSSEMQHRKRAGRWKWAAIAFGLFSGVSTFMWTCGERVLALRDGVAEEALSEKALADWRGDAKEADKRHDDVNARQDGDITELKEAVPAIVELQLQQGDDLRDMIIQIAPKGKRTEMRKKKDTLRRAESRARSVAGLKQEVGG